MTALILFFIVLGVLVFVHELGHFWAARLSGIKVTEFGLGFPPKAFGYKPKDSEVEYTVNWLPIGGFVKIFGEDYESISDDDPDKNRAFFNASKLKQIFVLVSGVLMNLLIALVLFTIASWSGGYVVTDQVENRDGFIVASVNPGSPADRSGLQSGDKIIKLESGSLVLSEAELDSESFTEFIVSSDSALAISIERDDDVQVIDVEPTTGLIAEDANRKAIGVYAESLRFEHASFFEGIKLGFDKTWSSLNSVVSGFWQIISSAFSGSGREVISSLAGPVGIAQLSAQAYDVGIGALLTFAAFLSINLVVLNLLPFPALDGGRVVMVLIEAIKGSPINSKVAGYVNLAGFALLLLLMLVITAQDIIRII